LKKSLIDDIRLAEDSDKGDPIRFTNQEFRKMFDLAKLNSADVFYDLGSGWGQSLIVALTEYDVKFAVGIEQDTERQAVSIARLKKRGLEARTKIVPGDFQRLYDGELPGADLSEATVVFYGLTTDNALIEAMKHRSKPGCRLIYYFNGLFPEIKAELADFPFYVSSVPFKKPTSEMDWLNSVVRKRKSSLGKERLTADELWDELTHDCDVYGDASDIGYYKRRLRELLS
jgi:precorrin-6B methylase 2